MEAEQDWHLVTHVGIDAGCLIIGDPSYFLTESDYDWIVLDDSDKRVKAIPFRGDIQQGTSPATGYDGPYAADRGALVSTGFGDGCYPVEVRYDEDTGRVAEVRIRFIDDDRRALFNALVDRQMGLSD